jgi:hypothetical protein
MWWKLSQNYGHFQSKTLNLGKFIRYDNTSYYTLLYGIVFCPDVSEADLSQKR